MALVEDGTRSGWRGWQSRETNLLRAVIRGLGSGALVGATLASMLAGYEQQLLPLPFNLLLFALLGFAFISAGDGILSLVWSILGFLLRRFHAERAHRRLHAIPHAQLGQFLAAMLFLYGRVLFPESIFTHIGLSPSTHPLVWSITLGGALIGVARMPIRRGQTQAMLMSGALLLDALSVGWLLYRGSDDYLARPQITAGNVLALPNPGLPGAYTVQFLTYSSGTDRHRREFGADATLMTPTTDEITLAERKPRKEKGGTTSQ
jgi:hypothetical protein